jgi:aspartyl-tRNA(Asn)/glutamyl-tRNA(Gln) amidotransferase subunit C
MSDALSRAEVARIAELAHLELTDAEADAFTRQLGDILAYATQVQALDTSGVPPTSHVLTDVPLDRDDVETPCLDRQTAVAAAPDGDEQAGLFRVPRVIG